MGTFLLLIASSNPEVGAELTSSGAESGFGLNFDVLETNLVNLVIIIGVLFYFGRKVVGKTLSDRREKIETAIKSAEQRAKEAATALNEQQQKMAQAQAEAERILAAAAENARVAKENILAAAAQDIERMRETATQDLNSERERAIAQIRASVVAQALQKVESQLSAGIGDSAQQQLIDRSIALLGGKS